MAEANNSSKRTTYGCYSPDGSGYEPGYPGRKKQSPVVKWYDVKMSFEEKARFNLLTYQDIIAWQQEMMALSENNQSDVSEIEGRTFWTNDKEERLNVSNGEYEAFLSENHLDVSNRNQVDFGVLAAQIGEESTIADKPPGEPESEEDILARINAANGMSSERNLTDEEIAALFAAMANN